MTERSAAFLAAFGISVAFGFTARDRIQHQDDLEPVFELPDLPDEGCVVLITTTTTEDDAIEQLVSCLVERDQ